MLNDPHDPHLCDLQYGWSTFLSFIMKLGIQLDWTKGHGPWSYNNETKKGWPAKVGLGISCFLTTLQISISSTVIIFTIPFMGSLWNGITHETDWMHGSRILPMHESTHSHLGVLLYFLIFAMFKVFMIIVLHATCCQKTFRNLPLNTEPIVAPRVADDHGSHKSHSIFKPLGAC